MFSLWTLLFLEFRSFAQFGVRFFVDFVTSNALIWLATQVIHPFQSNIYIEMW